MTKKPGSLRLLSCSDAAALRWKVWILSAEA
jgi:hypothetical protein